MQHTKRNDRLTLYKEYTPEEFPRYDNYDAINVNKVADIPVDYDGAMGVPITFLDKFNPEQFEIVGQMANTSVDEHNKGYPFINGKKVYARIIIKRKVNGNANKMFTYTKPYEIPKEKIDLGGE